MRRDDACRGSRNRSRRWRHHRRRRRRRRQRHRRRASLKTWHRACGPPMLPQVDRGEGETTRSAWYVCVSVRACGRAHTVRRRVRGSVVVLLFSVAELELRGLCIGTTISPLELVCARHQSTRATSAELTPGAATIARRHGSEEASERRRQQRGRGGSRRRQRTAAASAQPHVPCSAREPCGCATSDGTQGPARSPECR